jgi:hypothetical protein
MSSRAVNAEDRRWLVIELPANAVPAFGSFVAAAKRFLMLIDP